MTTDLSSLLKTSRLQRLATLVPPCECMIDVGTDHGWLPIALVLDGIAQRAIASDVLPDPLAIARNHIHAYRLEHAISARLGDGLSTLEPGEAGVVTIAGMGLKSILKILRDHPPHELGAHTLIIQTPQIDNTLRHTFSQHYPWHVIHEELLFEAPQVYHMLKVDLTSPDSSYSPPESILDALISPYLQAHQDVPTLRRAVSWLTHRKQLRVQGLQRAKHAPDEATFTNALAHVDALQRYDEALQARHDAGTD